MHKLAGLLGLIVLVVLTVLTAASGSAAAQNKPKRAPKVIQLEEIKIEGRVQKPNAFYILNRSNLGYEVYDLRTSFVRSIVRSVQSTPF
jgi:hypothetical protein